MRVQLGRWLLLAAAVPGVARAEVEVPVVADTLVYADDDHVTVVTSQGGATVRFDDQDALGARVIVDVVSAASVDVVSQATRAFEETRVEVDFDLSYGLTGDLTSTLGVRASFEPDYQSTGGWLALTQELAGGDTVGFARYGLTLDTVGRVDTAYHDWSRWLATHAGEIGVTQAIDARTLVRGVYSLTVQDGYMEKPYRHVPLFTAASLDQARADGVALGLDTFDDYRLPEKPAEEVPDLRVRHALFLRGLRHVAALRGSVRLDYRFYVDSWGMTAHTVEAAVVAGLGRGFTLEARERAHLQTPVSFWERTYVVEEGSVPRWRSVDRELAGAMSSTSTVGVAWRRGGFAVYLDAGVMLSRFEDFLFLDERTAFLGQFGLRVTP